MILVEKTMNNIGMIRDCMSEYIYLYTYIHACPHASIRYMYYTQIPNTQLLLY